MGWGSESKRKGARLEKNNEVLDVEEGQTGQEMEIFNAG